jgi:chorismate synthase
MEKLAPSFYYNTNDFARDGAKMAEEFQQSIMGNTFGHLFRITTFGESHGGGVGVVVDGCPPQLELSAADLQYDLDRRRPGQSKITTPRQEADQAQILSGVFEGRTLGTPIAIVVHNKDARSQDYDEMATKFRPSHADATYQVKYGIRNWHGGGRSSARETIGRVAAGAIAKKILRQAANVEILAYVRSIHTLEATVDPATLTAAHIEANIVRCPDPVMAEQAIALIEAIRKEGNSVGGTIECIVRNVPVGLGEPVFDKLEADLAKALLSLPATKGFEIGSGFAGTRLTGKEHNDAFYQDGDRLRTRTNHSGGIQGGISNGEDITLRIAFKPTATILLPQKTVTTDGQETELTARGRHDPCVLPRAVPMVEAMVALVLCDHYLRQKAIVNSNTQ